MVDEVSGQRRKLLAVGPIRGGVMSSLKAGEWIETVRRTGNLAPCSVRNHDLLPAEVDAGA
jgi:hypothetical protein